MQTIPVVKEFPVAKNAMPDRWFNATTWFVDRHVKEGRGRNLAFLHHEGQTTYQDLCRQVSQTANLFRSLGIQIEQRIALILPDCLDFPLAFWGAIKAGMIPVPLNTMLTIDDYRYLLQDSRATAVVVAHEWVDKVLSIQDDLPHLRHILVAEDPASGWRQQIDRQPNCMQPVQTTSDDVAFWLYSSGSTGAPKAAMHLHRDLLATAELYGREILTIRESDRVFSISKLFFAYGLGNSMTFPMHVGASAVLMRDRPTVDRVQAMVDQHRPTLFFAVPTLYAHLLAGEGVRMPESVRMAVSAGEALPADLVRRWRQRYGTPILDGLGSTEMLHIFLSNRPDQIREGSSGFPVPGYELRIVDENGHDVAPGELGELIVRGPSSALGYWNQRDKSKRTFRGEWTYTGDKYVRYPDGSYHFAGRGDDMLKVGGIWVSPFEVETALNEHPDVLEAAVVGHPDDQGMVKPKAYVVRSPGSNVTADSLVQFSRDRLAAWKYPRWVEFVSELPKTASGKVQRFRLRDTETPANAANM